MPIVIYTIADDVKFEINENQIAVTQALAGVYSDDQIFNIIKEHQQLSPANQTAEDQLANIDALEYGGRVITVHIIDSVKILCITEPLPLTADTCTTVLYPNDY